MKTNERKFSKLRLTAGIIFGILFLISMYFNYKLEGTLQNLNQVLSILLIGLSLANLLPKKVLDIETPVIQMPKESRRFSGRTIVSTVVAFIIIPLTVWAGYYYFGEKKYYLISLLVIAETMLPFFINFEKRKPQARELVLISVLCAIGVAGRAAFYVLPQFKPVAAIVIISGVCLGGEAGFLVGAVTAFVSNFFFGQGAWTYWQMFAFGMLGFVSGALFQIGLLRKSKVFLSIFGAIATIIIYGGIVNSSSVIMWQPNPTVEMFISSYVMGLPFDAIHALATAFFLYFAAGPMIEKIDRVKTKYGI